MDRDKGRGNGGTADGNSAGRSIDSLVYDAVFAQDGQAREKNQRSIIATAASQGAYPASIQGLYDAAGKGLYSNKTVPAINIRGITYDVARAVFRAAMKHRVGAFVFEIARSEIGYTAQRPLEYTACVLAAAIKEGYRGPVFLQGDHFQFNRKGYAADAKKELGGMTALVREAIDAGFYNIDIDASTLVDLDRPALAEQQENNCVMTAEMTKLMRSIQPAGVTVSVGGEIGEVGGKNSTVEDFRVFMSGYLASLGTGMKGISKISVQTGTSHGGVVLPDGSIASVTIDFKVLEEISKIAREEYGMAGAVQHGASTLPDDAFDIFPQVGTAEVHLATGFQNMIYESPYFPKDLLARMCQSMSEKYAGERSPKDTDDQFFYKTRKRCFGDFKREMWELPRENLDAIGQALEDRFALLYQKLAVVDTVDLVERYVAAGVKA